MSKADIIFKQQLTDILFNGVSDEGHNVRPTWENGTEAYSRYITHSIATVDPKDGVPIQTIRKIAWKSGLREILAIYQKRATTRKEFEDAGVFWWEPWFDENGTLGKSYAFQLKKEIEFPEGRMTQFDRVLYLLKNRPMDRRMITNMFNLEELNDMTLPPCAFMTMWSVRGEYLDLMLVQRSGDSIPAAGFGGINTVQYYFLQAMVAQVTGYKIGKFTHVVNNLHIYNKHMGIADKLRMELSCDNLPTLWINPDIDNFYDFTDKDIKLIDYEFKCDIKGIDIAI